MRLIDADAVEKQAYEDVHYHAELEDWEFDVVTHYLDHALTIDAVPVVRCTECKHRDPENHHCDHPAGATNYFPRKDDDFCSYGERKDGEG